MTTPLENRTLAAAEAILFAAGDSIALIELAAAVAVPPSGMEELAQALTQKFDRADSGLTLLRLEDRVQLVTRPEHLKVIEGALSPIRKQTLTQAALETLCVVAYRQPVTRMEIELIRGVQCDRAVVTLVNHGLICEVGRRETVGRPILYGTTEEFLRHFGLSSLKELPPVEEFTTLSPESEPQGEIPI